MRGMSPHPHPAKNWEEMGLMPGPIEQHHPEEVGFQVAAQLFGKMQEPKITKLKGRYSSSARLIFQFWLKDIYVHVEYRRLIQREALQLVKNFTMEHAWNEVEFYMDMGTKEEQSFKGLIDHLHD